MYCCKAMTIEKVVKLANNVCGYWFYWSKLPLLVKNFPLVNTKLVAQGVQFVQILLTNEFFKKWLRKSRFHKVTQVGHGEINFQFKVIFPTRVFLTELEIFLRRKY